MESIEYFEPKTVAEACALLAERENAKLLAGGVSLGVLLKSKLVFPEALINLKTIQGLRKVERTPDGGLTIGALCRHREIEGSALVRGGFGILAEAASKIASPAIRNMGTIGGNLCHADPAADFPPALIALDAELKIAGPEGSRVIPVRDFFTDYYETVLAPEEILVEIRISPLPPRTGGSCLDLTKTHNSVGIVNTAALIALDGDENCIRAGLGVGGVASTPYAVPEVSGLIGKPVETAAIRSVADAAMARARPISNAHASEDYRREMTGVLVRRALAAAAEKARGAQAAGKNPTEGEP